MNPIVGPRFHLKGANYDLCEQAFHGLSEDMKKLFEKIDLPVSNVEKVKRKEAKVVPSPSPPVEDGKENQSVAPMKLQVNAVCPPNAKPGDVVSITTPVGRVHVPLPPDALPGKKFTLMLTKQERKSGA